MQFVEHTVTVAAAAATAQTLPNNVARVVSGYSMGALGTAGDTATALTIITSGTASGADCLFEGTPQAPAKALTLGTAAAADQILVFNVILQGDIPAYL